MFKLLGLLILGWFGCGFLELWSDNGGEAAWFLDVELAIEVRRFAVWGAEFRIAVVKAVPSVWGGRGWRRHGSSVRFDPGYLGRLTDASAAAASVNRRNGLLNRRPWVLAVQTVPPWRAVALILHKKWHACSLLILSKKLMREIKYTHSVPMKSNRFLNIREWQHYEMPKVEI